MRACQWSSSPGLPVLAPWAARTATEGLASCRSGISQCTVFGARAQPDESRRYRKINTPNA